MKIFSHGSMVNFQSSAREMCPQDLKNLIHDLIRCADSVITGTIDLEKEEIRVYGRVESVQFDELANRVTWRYTFLDQPQVSVIEHTIEELTISHEAIFDILDNKNQPVSYRVIYITFTGETTGGEITYFLASEHSVPEPLACVAEFWQQVNSVGREVDFQVCGCSAHRTDQ